MTGGFQFVRYMDDILILTPTRWCCRRACRLLNQVFQQLGLSRHPDKTWIGKLARFAHRFLQGGVLERLFWMLQRVVQGSGISAT